MRSIDGWHEELEKDAVLSDRRRQCIFSGEFQGKQPVVKYIITGLEFGFCFAE